MCKSIADYLNDDGPGAAIGKTFSLYGMVIGEFVGARESSSEYIFIHPINGKMEVPMMNDQPINRSKKPQPNPILSKIIQAESMDW